MLLNRRGTILAAVGTILAASLRPASHLLSQTQPTSALKVLATALRAQYRMDRQHPLLISQTVVATERLTVHAGQVLPMELARGTVVMPYLSVPADRVTEAQELAGAYNQTLNGRQATLADSPAFDFPHRLLDADAVAQFRNLHPGGNVYSDDVESRRRSVPAHYRTLFGGSTSLTEVSSVGMVPDETLAVVGLRTSGGGCGMERWMVFQRSGRVWQDVPWGASRMTCA